MLRSAGKEEAHAVAADMRAELSWMEVGAWAHVHMLAHVYMQACIAAMRLFQI